MNQSIMGLIGGATPQLHSAPKHEVSHKKNAFKDTMNGALKQQKPISQENEVEKKVDKSTQGQSTEKIKRDKVRERTSKDTDIEGEERGTDVEEQLLPILQNLMEILNMSEELFGRTLEQLGLTIGDLAEQENFSNFLDAYDLEGSLMLNLDGETIKKIADIWKSIEDLQQLIPNKLPQAYGESDTTQSKMPIEEVVEAQEESVTQVIEGSIQAIKNADESDKNESGNFEEKVLFSESNISEEILGLKIPLQSFDVARDVKFWDNKIEQANVGVVNKTIVDQVIEKIEINKFLRSNEIIMELVPKELGKLALKLTEQNGMITAQIKVDSERTKEMIMENIQVLIENLEKQGLSVEGFQVDVRGNESQGHMQKQQQKASKRIQELISREIESLNEKDIKEEHTQYTQVDYMA